MLAFRGNWAPSVTFYTCKQMKQQRQIFLKKAQHNLCIIRNKLSLRHMLSTEFLFQENIHNVHNKDRMV